MVLIFKWFVMKNYIQITGIFLLIIVSSYGQQEKGIMGTNNWLYGWTEFKPKLERYGEPTEILTGNITEDTKLTKRNIYLLMGNVFVTNNATLTIEPGTVILGDYKSNASLTISKGAKIVADGLETDPIIFTSNRSVKRAGDWGGLILLGEGLTNRFGNGSVASYYSDLKPKDYVNTNYGGDNALKNSGVMKYVRIEYAGKRLKNGSYFNGLLLACVGNETTLENIMISYSAGNSLEILGGEVNLSKIVSYRSNKNDFKFNYGTQCVLNNSLAVRSPYISSSSGARCMKIASYDKEEDVDFSKDETHVIAKNITLINQSENLNSDIEKGLVKEAVFVAQNAKLDMNKSVISGFNPAVILEDKIIVNQENLEKIAFTDMYFNNCNGNIFIENNSNNDDLENWYGNTAFFNVYSKSYDSETFIDLNNDERPDFRLRINKIIATNDDPDLRTD